LLSTGETEDDELFVPLLRLQALAGLPGRVSLAALSVDGGVQAVTDAAAAAHSALPGVWARPLRQIAAAQGAILGKLQRMMVLLTLVVLVLTGLCLVTTLMAIVVERGSEIGLMRSIGAADSEILEMFLGEVGLLGILGSAIGIALGALGAHVIGSRLFGAPIEPRAAVVPTVLLISLGLCLISVLVPLRRALSVQPAAALRGD
jgi:putative ABC transport system permease protein